MKLEVELTEEQLNLLILSTEMYARSLMNQPDMVADILAEDRFFYDKGDTENDKSLYDVRASEPYHGGTEPLMRIRILEKSEVAGGEKLGEKSNNTV